MLGEEVISKEQGDVFAAEIKRHVGAAFRQAREFSDDFALLLDPSFGKTQPLFPTRVFRCHEKKPKLAPGMMSEAPSPHQHQNQNSSNHHSNQIMHSTGDEVSNASTQNNSTPHLRDDETVPQGDPSPRMYVAKFLNINEKSRDEIILHFRCSGHPNIAECFYVYDNTTTCPQHKKGRYFILVMELLDGGDLLDLIQKTPCFTEAQARVLIKQIAEAVHRCHSQDISHRDIKPENLVFASKSPDAPLKLTDFGFAHFGPASTPLGTPIYSSPEIVKAFYHQKKIIMFQDTPGAITPYTYDYATDMWSIGVILYILLVGEAPFQSESGNLDSALRERIVNARYRCEGEKWTSVSKEAVALVKNLLCIDPKERISAFQLCYCSWIRGMIPSSEDGDKSSTLYSRLPSVPEEQLLEALGEATFVKNEASSEESEEEKEPPGRFEQGDADEENNCPTRPSRCSDPIEICSANSSKQSNISNTFATGLHYMRDVKQSPPLSMDGPNKLLARRVNPKSDVIIRYGESSKLPIGSPLNLQEGRKDPLCLNLFDERQIDLISVDSQVTNSSIMSLTPS